MKRAAEKYVVVLADGCADFPLESLGGRTPLEAAATPALDALAAEGVVGQINPIPPQLSPGSDVGNLTVLGYDPLRYLTGRAPLEAAARGVSLGPDQVAFRCNLITLKDGRILDYSAGHISSEEAAELIEALRGALESEEIRFYPGVQYRHLMVAPRAWGNVQTTPPHDVPGEPYVEHLPRGEAAERLIELIHRSWEVLQEHPVNAKRRAAGKGEANSIWLWGQGTAPQMPPYPKKYGLQGGVISAVDLVRGIGRYAGLEPIPVEGITGFLDTNYAGKAIEGLRALQEGLDFVYIHVEAPDEAAHLGDPQAKIQAIEAIDREIVSRVLEFKMRNPHCRVAVLPDHITSVATRTHVRGRVPFVAAGAGLTSNGIGRFSEIAATGSELDFGEGYRWMDWFLGVEAD
ncbi:MAG: homoserine kinase [Candidatus Poribacteria bacterium]|nr:MAG: homoserine kinase [Candidatus Poribacteria bacterium]